MQPPSPPQPLLLPPSHTLPPSHPPLPLPPSPTPPPPLPQNFLPLPLNTLPLLFLALSLLSHHKDQWQIMTLYYPLPFSFSLPMLGLGRVQELRRNTLKKSSRKKGLFFSFLFFYFSFFLFFFFLVCYFPLLFHIHKCFRKVLHGMSLQDLTRLYSETIPSEVLFFPLLFFFFLPPFSFLSADIQSKHGLVNTIQEEITKKGGNQNQSFNFPFLFFL